MCILWASLTAFSLQRVLEVAVAVGLPVAVHHSGLMFDLAGFLGWLRPEDIKTHCFEGTRYG